MGELRAADVHGGQSPGSGWGALDHGEGFWNIWRVPLQLRYFLPDKLGNEIERSKGPMIHAALYHGSCVEEKTRSKAFPFDFLSHISANECTVGVAVSLKVEMRAGPDCFVALGDRRPGRVAPTSIIWCVRPFFGPNHVPERQSLFVQFIHERLPANTFVFIK